MEPTTSPEPTMAPTSSPTLSPSGTDPGLRCNDGSILFDPSGNPYGVFIGKFVDQSNIVPTYSVEITYSSSGVTAVYPEHNCGQTTPQPVTSIMSKASWHGERSLTLELADAFLRVT